MRTTTLIQFTRLGELLRSGRGGNAASREARRGCGAREEPVHSTALLGRGWGERDMQLAIIQLLLHKQKGPGGLSVALLSGEGFRKHSAGKRKDSPQERTVAVLLSSSPTGRS